MSKDRMRVVNATIQKELSTLFTREVTPEFQCLITITEVDTSPDLRLCNVYISVLGGKNRIGDLFAFLDRKKPDFHEHLRKRVAMKYIPIITFHLDQSAERASRLTSLIDSLHIPPDETPSGDTPKLPGERR
ncbi:MAG: hypothetical protein RL095_2620 [Verrucomicrobiota bacterium]|jgi:ribosome-binding factor A